MYVTNFALRCKNSSGTVLKTFVPLVGIGRNVNVRRGESVKIARTGIADTDESYFRGWKQRVEATFMDTNKYISGAATYDTLEAVFNALPAGGTMEYSLDGGSNWVPCEFDDPERSKPQEKNEAVTVSISLLSRAIVSSPFDVS